MKRFLPFVLAILLLGGCVTTRTQEGLPSPASVDLDRLMGKWYVVASIPTLLEREPYAAMANLSRGKRGIEIEYTFLTDSFDGTSRRIPARALIDNPGINTDWTLSVAWPFGTDVRVVHTDETYSTVVLANPDRKKVWILSRRSTINGPAYSDIILRLQDLGFNVGNIRSIPHRS